MSEVTASRQSRVLSGWVLLVTRFPWIVVLLAVLTGALGLDYTRRHVGINTSTTDMLSPELPFRRNAKIIKRAFPQFHSTLTFVVEGSSVERADWAAEQLTARLSERPDRFRRLFYPEAEPFFRHNGLLYLDVDELYELSDRLAEAQPFLGSLKQDPSLRGLAEVLETALTESDDAAERESVASVLGRMAATLESLNGGKPEPLSWRRLMSGDEEESLEDRRKFIVAEPVTDYASFAPVADALDALAEAVDELGLTPDRGVRVRVLGKAVMFQEELESVKDGMGLVGLLSFTLVMILLFVGLRSAKMVAAALVTLVVGLIWTALFATVAVGELNLISVAFAVLFIGLSVDFGIHYCLRYREAVGRGAATRAALAEAAEGVGGALTLSAVAATISFFSFLPTDYRGISELGLISGAGMFIALFANLTLLPALLALLPLRRPAAGAATGGGLRLQGLIERHARSILIGAALLGLLAALTLPFARFDDDPLNLRDPESESVSTLRDLLADSRVQPYDAEYLAADLAAATALADRLEEVELVDSARTIQDYVPKEQDEKLGLIDEMAFFLAPLVDQPVAPEDIGQAPRRQALEALNRALTLAEGELEAPAARLGAALKKLGTSDQLLAQAEALLLSGLPRALQALGDSLAAAPVGIEDLPGDLRERNLAADGRAIVTINPAEDLQDSAARRRFVAAVRAVEPAVSGPAVAITEAGQAVIRSFQEAAVYALVLILALLLAVLRSWRETLMVFAPLFLAALLTAAATVLFGQPFNFANVIVLPLLFGLGVAFGIHIVMRRRRSGVKQLLQTSTPRAVVFSALTTIGSFCSLSISSHVGTASMGLLLTVAISLTMVCTLTVLPALLAVASGGTRRS